MALGDEISWAMRAAPLEVRQDPSIALVAAQTPGDTQSHAEVMAHTLNQKAIGRAVDDVGRRSGGKGVFGATLGWLGEGVKGAMDMVGSGIETVGHVANMPLEQVKQQYRYLRDVQARHGFGAMLMDAIPMTAGAVGGGMLLGPGGIALGLAAAGKLHEELEIPGITHRDSWDRTAGPDYVDPHGGESVSPGRDAARFLNFLGKHIGVHVEQQKGFDLYDAVSGLGDGIFSVVADPLAGAGMVRKNMMVGDEVRGIVTKKLAPRWGGIAAKETELAPLVAQNVPVKRAFEHLAELDAGTIGAKYRKLRPFAADLGDAKSVDEVGQVFQDAIAAGQYTQRTLPRRTVANAAFGDLLRDADAGLRGLALQGLEEVEEGGRTVLRGSEAGLPTKAVRKVGSAYNRLTTFVPSSFNEVTNELSRTTLYFNDPSSAGTVYDLARWGHTDRMAKHVAEQWSRASVAEKQVILRNVLADNLGNVMELSHPGWTTTADGAETLARLGEQLDGLFGGIDAGHTTPWGFGKDGRSISRLPKAGETLSVPILEGQSINVPMPDYMTYSHQLTALRNGQVSKFLAGADDFLYNQFTQRVFRRWALVSGGFALRASAQDVIPYLFKAPGGMVRSGLANSMAKRGWKIEADEEEHILAAMTGWLAKKTGVTDEQIYYAAADLKVTDGHRITTGVKTGHSGDLEIVGMNEYVSEELYSQIGRVSHSQRDPSLQQAWAAGHQDFNIQWHTQAKTMAEMSPASRAAAVEYRAAKAEGVSEFEATHRATLKAKSVLDTTDEKILSQHERHYTATRPEGRPVVPSGGVDAFGNPIVGPQASTLEQALPVGSGQLEWVPGKAGQPGHWEQVGTKEVGQWTAQPTLVNPAGNVPGGMRTGTEYGFGEGATDAFGRPIDVPSTTTVPEKQLMGHEPTVPGRQQLSAADVEELAAREGAVPFAVDPHMDWAGVIVENMKGTVYGQDGTLHDELLAALGEGRAPEWELMKDIAEESQPAKIIGAYEMPAAPWRLNNALFRKINMFVNWSARTPIYRHEFDEAMKEFIPKIGKGLTEDEAMILARTKATKRMLPHIDNPAERTLMAETMRNWIPFYAAQQQAYARMWRLLAEDPAAFRRIQLAYTSLAEFGGVYDDEANNQHLIMPGTGWLGKAVPGILGTLGVPVVGGVPAAFSGSLKSLTSVSPFMESGEFVKVGPLVAMGARALNNFLPETQGLRAGVKSITEPIVGEIGSSQPMWEMVVPNATMRNILKSTVINDNRTQARSVLDAVQYLEFKQNVEMDKWVKKGNDPNSPDAPRVVPGPGATDMERAQFIDRVKNHARILGLTKAMIGAVSPLAPAAQIGEYQLKSELYDMIKKDGISVAIQKFLEKNPDATPYAVFQTDAGTPSPIESTHPTQQWVRANMKFITDKRYSAAASYFVPQTEAPFEQKVYNEQMAMGLRRVKAPETLIRDIETKQGNDWYFHEYRPARDAALGRAHSARERRLISQEWAQKGGTNAKGEVVQSLDSMKLQNPVWYTDFSSGGRDVRRQLALSQMRAALGDNKAPDSPMASKIAGLIEDFDRHASASLPGRTDSYASTLRKRENLNWQNYLKKRADDDPSLVMVVNGVFRGLEA